MRFKNEKGSITIFVLVALLFMSAFLMISYANNVNKSKIAKEQLDIMGDIYYKEDDRQSYDDAYYNFMKENKNLITATVENKYTIEIKNASKNERCSYRIYGNTEGLGDKIENLFDPELNFTPTNNRGITIEYLQDEGCYLINGTASATADHGNRFINIPITTGEYFSIRADYISGSVQRPNGTERAYVYLGQGNEIDTKTNWQYLHLYNNDTKLDHVACKSNYITAVWFYIAGGITFDNYKIRILLERSEFSEEYENVGKYRVPIAVERKNLVSKRTIIENGFIEQEDGSFYAQLSSAPHKRTLYENKDKVPGSFTISYYTKFILHNDLIGCYPWVFYTDGTNRSLSGLDGAENKKPTEYVKVTFTTPSTQTVDYILWSYFTGGTQTFVKDMQIEYGDTATDYEPYAQKYNIYLDSPLCEGDYIDFKSGKVKRADGTEENIELPEILTYEDYTKIEVITEVVPSKIEVEYVGYDI